MTDGTSYSIPAQNGVTGTGAETDYTLAAGPEGQIIHFVIAGGDSTAAGTAATTVPISQVRDPSDCDILRTHSCQPSSNS